MCRFHITSISAHKLACLVVASGTLFGLAATNAAARGGPRETCSGTPSSPGTLSGVYNSNVTITGACEVNQGPAVVNGNLTVSEGATLVAAFALNDQTGSGSSSLTVSGNLRVESGGTLFLGCDPQKFPCLDDPSHTNPTLSSSGVVGGNLTADNPLGVIVHNSTIGGNVDQKGGGGGFTCEPSGIFAMFESPAFSDYEDSRVNGNLSVMRLTSCWLGVVNTQVGGNLKMMDNQLNDPDAIEILANQVGNNLICQRNSRVWNSAEETEALFPRVPRPNTVQGNRIGQCVLASPVTEGGPPGPGPF